MEVPKLAVPKTKLEKLADDLAKLSGPDTVNVTGGGAPVPTFQRQGYLEKLGHTRLKWFKRFFVLRDSFMLAYNLQKSDYTVEPRAAIHLGNSTITMCEHNGKEFCFMIETQQRDKFLFSAESPSDRDVWMQDLETSSQVTHANMVKLAVENQCLAEEKGAGAVALENSTSALAIFSNEEYIQNTPITGGAEGWLRTAGFNPDEERPNEKGSFRKKGKKELTKCYFILRDSHLLMFNGGDILTKPRGVMFLLGTNVVENSDRGGDGDYHFTVKSPECGDEIELVASSNKIRTRWCQALRVGSRVTYPDLKLLMREHELLASVTMTPRAAPVITPAVAPVAKNEKGFNPIITTTDTDLQGEQLDPGVQQAYDAQGNPILRNPEGKLVTFADEQVSKPEEILPSTPRYNASGQQLDPFNRALPPGAVPMFTKDGTPIGVGPDGQHYLPDGSVVEKSADHYDVDGKKLDNNTVVAADAVSTDLNVAIKVRTKMKGDGSTAQAVDALGRTFREGFDEKSMDGATTIKNADGVDVPLASARRLESSTGALQGGDTAAAAAAAKRDEGTKKASEEKLKVMVEDEDGNEKELGVVEVSHNTTLSGVRSQIHSEVALEFPDFVFLFNGVPMMRYEERDKLAIACMPEVFIRGKELKKVTAKKFSKKVEALLAKQDEEKETENEFMAMMKRVREGKQLKSTKQAVFDD